MDEIKNKVFWSKFVFDFFPPKMTSTSEYYAKTQPLAYTRPLARVEHWTITLYLHVILNSTWQMNGSNVVAFFLLYYCLDKKKKNTLNTVIPTAARNRNCRGVSAKILSVILLLYGAYYVCVTVPFREGRGGAWAYPRGARANFSRDSTSNTFSWAGMCG